MKHLFVVLSLFVAGVAAQAEVVTLCGTYRSESSDGMLPVVRDLLDVPEGPFTPGFTTYELEAAGRTRGQVMRAAQIIGSLVPGQSYCLTGEAYKRPNFRLALIPQSVQPYRR